MSTTTSDNTYAFQAEIKQLLHLLSHSLYQNREITIRELISNASDALDKLRHIGLTEEKYRDEKLEISVEPDSENKILTIRDNGIGMTKDDLIKNLGTIAHSGSLEFLKNMSADKKDVSLIGQFGVGFYSAFMLSDKVEVITRCYSEESGWRWESDGTGSFSIEPASDVERGTQVKLYLKKDLDEFTRAERLKYILNKYSTFVPHPIQLEGEHINNQPPIWVEPKSQLKEQQYEDFYQFLSHRTDESPMWHLHLSSDSPFQFHSILYCPQTNIESMGFGRIEHGLSLCAKRILVQNDCRELLPEYLRFVYGIVDSADLPLNVSREALQDNTVFRKISKVLVKKVLDHLHKVAEGEEAEYLTFYRQFGVILKEGIHNDFEHRERIAGLLRFPSSKANSDHGLTSLDHYIERAPDDQKHIYYIGGPDMASIENNPNLEIFQKKDIEVLFLTDPIDEFLLTALHKYKDLELKSIDSADVQLPEGEEKPDEESKDDDATGVSFQRVLEIFQEALGDQVEEVRESKRLTDSPCCLVSPQGGVSAQLQKVLSMNNKDFKLTARILEINPNSKLIRRLGVLSTNENNFDFIREVGRQLFSNAMLLEGFAPNVHDTVDRINRMIGDLADGKSTIIT